MRILQVIHGYPMRYNAGSEVYTQTLCHGLAQRHQVHVFTREEDAFAADYRLREECDLDVPKIKLHVVNNPRNKDRYRVDGIDRRFSEVLDCVRPDVVLVGHLNHLSTSLLKEAAARELPILYTLHDYWLMCPRGQFMQTFPEDPKDLWPACTGQNDSKCAELCYARYFGGGAEHFDADLRYWSDWVARRMTHVRAMAELVDLFVAPAQYLLERYRNSFGLPANKLVYLDYGFDHGRLSGRARTPGEPFTFGYIGTHIPAKGIHQLIEAFGKVQGDCRLRIWGRDRGQDTKALKALARSLAPDSADRISWAPEYKNQEIVRDVFNHVDAIVVPSVWVENSPLVIHEAQQVRVPVITANAGGMAEYVHHEVNGLLFEHRSVTSLAAQMQRMASEPQLAKVLGERGYLFSDDGSVVGTKAHVKQVELLCETLLRRRASSHVEALRGPWRITFDTNPDHCNFHCVMCEEHSRHRAEQEGGEGSSRAERLMPFELIEQVVTQAAPLGLREIIPSTMGEPLLYAHFENIIALCARHGIKLNLTTNGSFPRLGARAWAERIVPVASDVKISWNGATSHTQESIMRGSSWEKQLNGLRDFIAVRDEHAGRGGNRCRVTLQLTFLESNLHELLGIIELAIEHGVDRVKGHHVWTHFEALEAESLRRSQDSIHRWNEVVQAARELVEARRLPNGERLFLENFTLLSDDATFDLAPGGPCPFLGQEAWVSAEGRFDPCCAPDEKRRGLGSFGNLHESSLIDIWNGAAYRELLASYRNCPLCLGCNMRKPTAS